MYQIVAQLFGYVGVLGFVLSYIQKSRKGIIFFSFLSRLSFTTHYVLLGVYSGAVQDAIGGVASAVSSQRERYESKGRAYAVAAPIVIVGMTLLGGVLTYDRARGMMSLLPVIAMLLQNPALWLKKQLHIRLMTLAAIPFWFSYNFLSRSIPAMMCDTLSVISLVTALIRYNFLPWLRLKRCGGAK